MAKAEYKVVYKPNHPLADSKGCVKEHRLVWYEHNGPIPKGHIIHHKNENKMDNRIENLQLMERREHHKYHYKGFEHNSKSIKKMSKSWFKKGDIPWNKGKDCPQLKGINHGMYGKKHSEETLKKIREARAKQKPPMKGKKRSEETKRKISEALKKRNKR